MKIAIRAGHNFQAKGASALIDETTEDRKVKDSVIKYLQQLGHTVTDVTPGNMDSNSDLVYGVSRANNIGAELFVSIHFNKAYNSYNGAIGTEAWVYSKSDNITLDEQVAQKIVNALNSLGFKNRGVKESQSLYELKSTKMASIIVEVCFVEATEDVALYNSLGADKIGQAIAEAIANTKLSTNTNNVGWKQNTVGWWYDLGNGEYPRDKWMFIEGEYYLFDSEGYALSNKWFKDKEKWYYFLDSCKMAKSQWIKDGDKWYYILADGTMATQDVYVDNKWYKIGSDGVWVE